MQKLLNIDTRDLGDRQLDYDVVDLGTDNFKGETVNLESSDLENIGIAGSRITALEQYVNELASYGTIRYDLQQLLSKAQQQQAKSNLGINDNQIQVNTTAYWNSKLGYIPEAGTIIIYSDYKQKDGKNVPGIKIGSGNGYVQDLAFIDNGVSEDLLNHISNTIVHVTQQERAKWNNKVNIDDRVSDVRNETVIFTRLF
jgi:hypothetical protein